MVSRPPSSRISLPLLTIKFPVKLTALLLGYIRVCILYYRLEARMFSHASANPSVPLCYLSREARRGEERRGDSETEAEEDKSALGASHTDDPLSWGPWLDRSASSYRLSPEELPLPAGLDRLLGFRGRS